MLPNFEVIGCAIRRIFLSLLWIIDRGLLGIIFEGDKYMNYALINAFLKLLDGYKARLTQQQYRTLRGQAASGDVTGAKRGLDRLIRS